MRPADLLLNDPKALIIRPKLAVLLGVHEAVLLNQLHWALAHLESRVVEIDGERWLRAGIEWWCEELPYISEATIKRAFSNLRERGLVRTSRGRESSVYSIDFTALDALARDQIDPSARSVRSGETGQGDPAPCMKSSEEVEESSSSAGTADTLFTPPGPDPAPRSPSPKPSDDAKAEIEAKVEAVWAEYERVFAGHFKMGLTDPRRTMIRKGLKAVENDEKLCIQAVRGMWNYRRANPGGNMSIDAIFRTYPGGANLTDQISRWAENAEEDRGGSENLHVHPDAIRAKVKRMRLQVVEMYQQPGVEGVRERGETALQWLKDQAKEEPIIVNDQITGWRAVA